MIDMPQRDMSRSARVLLAAGLAVLVVLVVIAPAAARIYKVSTALGSTLDDVREETGLDILLPERIALGYDGQTYASGSGGQRTYNLSLAGAPNCGGANACSW